MILYYIILYLYYEFYYSHRHQVRSYIMLWSCTTWRTSCGIDLTSELFFFLFNVHASAFNLIGQQVCITSYILNHDWMNIHISLDKICITYGVRIARAWWCLTWAIKEKKNYMLERSLDKWLFYQFWQFFFENKDFHEVELPFFLKWFL